MNKKIIAIFIGIFLIIFSISGYFFYQYISSSTSNNQPTTSHNITSTDNIIEANTHEEASDYIWNENEVSNINLAQNQSTSTSSNVSIKNNIATISSTGVYQITGTLTNGQISINADKEDVVKIILNNTNITNATGPAIDIQQAKKVIIILADNSTNTLSDGSNYTTSDTNPNATINSQTDLTIYGLDHSTLNITGQYNDSINTADGLIIKNATININSADDGIRGKDYLVLDNNQVTIESNGDGLKSDNEEDTSQGYIHIKSGQYDITSNNGDGITAASNVTIDDGTFNISTGGGSNQTISNSDDSFKGIKATNNITIQSGTFNIDSADDSIHTNGTLTINDGDYTIASGDDGIHADTSIEINNGNFDIQKSYEGIESSIITINDGNIQLVSQDDGLNVAGGNDSSATMGGRAGGGGFDAVSEGCFLYINGGNIYLNSNGDGLDSNGSIVMTDGIVIVNGPINDGNGPLDYNGTFDISGGYLLAVGSSGMAQSASESSTQNSILVNFDQQQTANTIINIQDEAGNNILTYAPAKQFQSIAFSSSSLQTNQTYNIYLGGSSTGTPTNGLYANDTTYTPGNLVTSLTISGTVTTYGNTQHMMGGGPNNHNMMPPTTGSNTNTTSTDNTMSFPDNTNSNMTPPDWQNGTPPSGGGMTPPNGNNSGTPPAMPQQ